MRRAVPVSLLSACALTVLPACGGTDGRRGNGGRGHRGSGHRAGRRPRRAELTTTLVDPALYVTESDTGALTAVSDALALGDLTDEDGSAVMVTPTRTTSPTSRSATRRAVRTR